jgi:putative transposase
LSAQARRLGSGPMFGPHSWQRASAISLNRANIAASRHFSRYLVHIPRGSEAHRRSENWPCAPYRECGSREAGLDWGVKTFATVAYAPGAYAAFENDRLLNAAAQALKSEQRQLSTAPRGKRSKPAKKAKKALAKRHRTVASRRKNRIHHVTAKLIREHRLIVTEDMSIKNMTASAKGTADKPGRT